MVTTAAPVRTIFYGFGAWVAPSQAGSVVKWWPQDPATLTPPSDASKLITTDLTKNPAAVRAGRIAPDEIEADDAPHDGGLTRIGPAFPHGSMINSCWLSDPHYARLPAASKPGRIPAGMQCNPYELTSVLYWSGPLARRRFWGFHATIAQERGAYALCHIFPAGYSGRPGAQPSMVAWLDLATAAHPIEPGLTAIGTGSAPKTGALFLDSATATTLGASGTKLPPYAGRETIPIPRR
jgi:hypothetical protein